MKINSKVGFFLGLGLATSLSVLAATFTQFTPATGVLVGNANSPVTTAATSANIRALWSGTCDLTTFLRGDGACSQVSLTANVSGILPVANGGTNLNAAADDNTIIGNGTTWQTKAIPGCLDTTGNHLNYNSTTNVFLCGTSGPGGFTGLANPTATIGLTAVNGSATTALRSDGAPALSQAIVPTWTAQHTFTLTGASRTTASLYQSAAAPFLRITETDQAANSQDWGQGPAAGIYQFGALADADTSIPNSGLYLQATRSGATVTNVSFGNAAGSNPTYSFLGTGVATATGRIVSNAIGNGSSSGLTVTAAGNSSLALNDTANAADNRLWDFISATDTSLHLRAVNDANTVSSDWATIQRSGTTITVVNLQGTAVQANGVAVATVTSGSFTASFDAACTTTPTINYVWQRVGNQVTLQAVSQTGFPCTGDVIQFATTGTPAPTAIRPASSAVATAGQPDASDNGATTLAQLFVTPAGNIGFNRITTAGATANWTAAGSRNSSAINTSLVYMTNN